METMEHVDISVFEGHWVNTNPNAKWLAAITIRRTDTGWCMDTQSNHTPHQLGETRLVTYSDNMDYLAFKGEYQLPDAHISLTANTQKELIVITTYIRRAPGNHTGNQVFREFVCRTQT